MQTRFFQTAIKTIQHLLPTAADLQRGVAKAGREHLKYIEVKCKGKRVDITACSGRILMRIRKEEEKCHHDGITLLDKADIARILKLSPGGGVFFRGAQILECDDPTDINCIPNPIDCRGEEFLRLNRIQMPEYNLIILPPPSPDDGVLLELQFIGRAPLFTDKVKRGDKVKFMGHEVDAFLLKKSLTPWVNSESPVIFAKEKWQDKENDWLCTAHLKTTVAGNECNVCLSVLAC
jgi:hypothetical protein